MSDLRVTDHVGRVLVDDVSFQIRGGEILAVAGVQGNGQTELIQALLGLEDHTSGSAVLDGVDLVGRSTKQVLHAGVGYVPEDREHDGLIASFTIAENLILDTHDRPPFARGITLRKDVIAEKATALVQQFDVRTPSIASTAGTLSGGNKQKVVLAREMSRPLRLLVAAQPTRGLDVGSIEFVHEQVIAQRDAGAAVLVVSSELDEVVALADRIAVMYRGRIVGVVPPDTPRDVLGLLMAGVVPDDLTASGGAA